MSSGGPPSSRPLAELENEKGPMKKIWKRIKEEPLVPFGIVATCAALFGAQRAISRGDSHQANKMFRYRIYAQGITVAFLIIGGVYYGGIRRQERRDKEEVIKGQISAQKTQWLKDLEAYETDMKRLAAEAENSTKKH